MLPVALRARNSLDFVQHTVESSDNVCLRSRRALREVLPVALCARNSLDLVQRSHQFVTCVSVLIWTDYLRVRILHAY